MNSTNAPRTAVSFSDQLSGVLSLENGKLFALALLLSIAPLWFGQHLPLVDLPQHAGQITALREMWNGNPTFTGAFEINWFTPYLLGYLLLYAISLLVPIAVATQIVVSLSVVAVPILTGRLLRAAGADERWKWLAIPCAYGFSFYWGFLLFFVAVPFALLFLIQTIRFVDKPTLQGGLGIALYSLFLFFCHVIALGFASLVALGYVVGRTGLNPKLLLLRTLPYVAALPIIVLWMVITYDSSSNVPDDPVVYHPFGYRLYLLVTQPSGLDAFSPLITPLVTGAVLLLPLLAGARPSRRPERWLPFVLGLLAFMIAPHYVFSAAYFYQRLGVFLVPLWLLGWDPPHADTRRADWVAMLVVVIWTSHECKPVRGFRARKRNVSARLRAAWSRAAGSLR